MPRIQQQLWSTVGQNARRTDHHKNCDDQPNEIQKEIVSEAKSFAVKQK